MVIMMILHIIAWLAIQVCCRKTITKCVPQPFLFNQENYEVNSILEDALVLMMITAMLIIIIIIVVVRCNVHSQEDAFK